jgi:hypothetical protein
MLYISVKCEYFSAKFVPNPALLPELLQHGMKVRKQLEQEEIGIPFSNCRN